MKHLWEPLVNLIKALTEMVSWQTKRAKMYAKIEDKVLPCISRILDLYPLAEPLIDTAIGILEKAAPPLIETFAANKEELTGNLIELITEQLGASPFEVEDLDEARLALRTLKNKIQGSSIFSDSDKRNQELVDEFITLCEQIEDKNLKAYCIEQAKSFMVKPEEPKEE